MSAKWILSLVSLVLIVGCDGKKSVGTIGVKSGNNQAAGGGGNPSTDKSQLGQKILALNTQINTLQAKNIDSKDCYTLGQFGYTLFSLSQRIEVGSTAAAQTYSAQFNQKNQVKGSLGAISDIGGGEQKDTCSPYQARSNIVWKRNLALAKDYLSRLSDGSRREFFKYNINLYPKTGNLKLQVLTESIYLDQFEKELNTLMSDIVSATPVAMKEAHKAHFIFKHAYKLIEFRENLGVYSSTTDSAAVQKLETEVKISLQDLGDKAAKLKDWTVYLQQLQKDLPTLKTQIDALDTELEKP